MSRQANSSNEADLQAIDRVRAAHIAGMNQGNADHLAGLFGEDAVQMPPNAPTNRGRATIHAWFKAFMDPFRAEFALEVEEVRAAGDWAFERGAYQLRLSLKAGGSAIQDTGKYITIYQKQPDGAWFIARDIWNSSIPLPGMP